jgi:hypothetical protein
VGGGTFFVYSSKLKHMNLLINYMIDFLRGVRVDGEPANYPENGPAVVRGDDGFFEWSREYRVGCQAKSGACFY